MYANALAPLAHVKCVVLENNKELGPKSPQQDVNDKGGGRYALAKGRSPFSHSGDDTAHNTELFALVSAPDNSDPNNNGRSYVLSCPCAKPVNQQCLERYEGEYLGVDAESCGFKFAPPRTLNCGALKPSCDAFCKGLGEKRMGVALACVGMDGKSYHCGRPGLATLAPPAPVLKCWSRQRGTKTPFKARHGTYNSVSSEFGQYCQAEVPFGLKEPKAITAGKHYTCVITQEDTVECWGKPPAPVPADLGKVKSIEAFDTHVCAIKMGGGLRCWGRPPPLSPPPSEQTAAVASYSPGCTMDDKASVLLSCHVVRV